MSKKSGNHYVQHEHIDTQNSKGESVRVFRQNHYGEEGFRVVNVNNNFFRQGVSSYDSLNSAVKSTE